MHLSEATIVALLSFINLSYAFPFYRELDTRALFAKSYYNLKLRSSEVYPTAGNTEHTHHHYQNQEHPRDNASRGWERLHGHHTEAAFVMVPGPLLERGRPVPRRVIRTAKIPATGPAARPVRKPPCLPDDQGLQRALTRPRPVRHQIIYITREIERQQHRNQAQRMERL